MFICCQSNMMGSSCVSRIKCLSLHVYTSYNYVWMVLPCEDQRELGDGIALQSCLCSQRGHTSSDGITGHTRSESRGNRASSSELGFSFPPPHATLEEALRGPRLRTLRLLPETNKYGPLSLICRESSHQPGSSLFRWTQQAEGNGMSSYS